MKYFNGKPCAVKGIEIKVGQVWRTRGGELATIHAFDADATFFPWHVKFRGSSLGMTYDGLDHEGEKNAPDLMRPITLSPGWVAVEKIGVRPEGLNDEDKIIIERVDGHVVDVDWYTVEHCSWDIYGEPGLEIESYKIREVIVAEPKVYSVRDVAEAIHAVTGVPRLPDFEAKITQLNQHLKKVTSPEYTEARDNLEKAKLALAVAQFAFDSFK